MYEDPSAVTRARRHSGRDANLIRGALVTLLLAGGLACGDASGPQRPAPAPAVSPARHSTAPSDSAAPRVVFLGDSLTAGFGLEEDQAYPAVIGRRLAELGLEAKIVNAGVSGDTTAGGLSRVDWLLRQSPEVLVVGLGGNDGLRGLSPEMTEANLRTTLERAMNTGARPILLGMRLPPNLGPDYVSRFEAIYPRLAGELGVDFVPFMLEGVAGDPALNLPDGIHPTAAGQERIADTVLPLIAAALRDLEQG